MASILAAVIRLHHAGRPDGDLPFDLGSGGITMYACPNKPDVKKSKKTHPKPVTKAGTATTKQFLEYSHYRIERCSPKIYSLTSEATIPRFFFSSTARLSLVAPDMTGEGHPYLYTQSLPHPNRPYRRQAPRHTHTLVSISMRGSPGRHVVFARPPLSSRRDTVSVSHHRRHTPHTVSTAVPLSICIHKHTTGLPYVDTKGIHIRPILRGITYRTALARAMPCTHPLLLASCLTRSFLAAVLVSARPDPTFTTTGVVSVAHQSSVGSAPPRRPYLLLSG